MIFQYNLGMKNYLALKASAGSGKTFALTVRYITLLLFDAKPNEILTLTFTNKAANEMSERIYHTLLSLGDDEAYLNAIMEQSGKSKSEILSLKPKLLNTYLNSELAIYTIDKFINKILREFCGYLGINDDFDIKEDNTDELSLKFLQSLDLKSFDRFVEFFLYENKKFNSLFEMFKNLIEHNETFQTIEIEQGLIDLQKEEVLKYAFKIKEFILNSNASNSAKNSVEFDDFDKLLKKGKTWLTKESVYDFSYFKKVANETLESYFQPLKIELKNYYKLRSTYSLNHLLELYQRFYEFRKGYLKNKNYLEFNDISNLVYELLGHTIDKDFLYFRLDSKFSHLLIDEFQDTSLLQYRILEPIIQEIVSGDVGEFKTFFYVGDTKQSIYRFRGGKRELFDYVSTQNSLVEVEALHTNYRSCETIVNYVNELFLQLPNYEYYEQHSIKKGGFVKVLEDEALQEEEPFKNVAKTIAELLKQGVHPNDIAILTYTNSDVLALYTYLTQKFTEIKITTEMTSRLINQENVKAVINAIKYLYFNEEIYKENCHAILGLPPLQPMSLSIDLIHNNLRHIVKYVATQLDVMDENVIKLIELCGSYEHIVDFVYEIDHLDATMVNKEQSGIQILTIFKSKGLEFDTVLLLDRVKRKNSDKSTLLFEYDEVNLKNVYYKIASLEEHDEHYKKALEKEKRLSFEDEINILYVALTRAKHNLFVFKKPKSSVFDLLNMQALSKGNLVVKEIKATLSPKMQKVNYTPLQLGKQEAPIAQNKKSEHYSLHSKYFGLATHYCLEMMHEFSLTSLSHAMQVTKSQYGNYLNSNDFIQIEQRIQKLLENEFFMDMVKESNFSKEQAIVYKDEVKIIDLLVEKEEEYIIFDYKTTKDELHEHVQQVAHYKKAIQNITQCSSIKGYILYLNETATTVKLV